MFMIKKTLMAKDFSAEILYLKLVVKCKTQVVCLFFLRFSFQHV